MEPIDYLSKEWENIFFTLCPSMTRDNAISATDKILFYFLVAHSEKNLFNISIARILREANCVKDLRDEILILYRNFYKNKKAYESIGLKLGTNRQIEILKMESELFSGRKTNLDSETLLNLYCEEIGDDNL